MPNLGDSGLGNATRPFRFIQGPLNTTCARVQLRGLLEHQMCVAHLKSLPRSRTSLTPDLRARIKKVTGHLRGSCVPVLRTYHLVCLRRPDYRTLWATNYFFTQILSNYTHSSIHTARHQSHGASSWERPPLFLSR